ncbi:MAG: carboxyl transferase domain-containing protein, partial [Patescibacteria group bacterium]
METRPDSRKFSPVPNPFGHIHKHEHHDNHKAHPEILTTPAYERVKLARNIDRPLTLDYINHLTTGFVEQHGDRLYADDPAIVGGLANFEGQTVMVIGQQRGKNTKENIRRNFGMPHPEGYRKAQRLMNHASRFGFPIITFVDSQGAAPGIGSEERGIGQAIAESQVIMMLAEVPIIATIIGEGESGGAIALYIANRNLMMQNAVFSVASPEAAAAILWKDSTRAPEAAESLKITAEDMIRFKIVD